MAKDYAKHRNKSNRALSNKKKPIPGWFWLLTGLVIGFLLGGLLYLKNFRTQNILESKIAALENNVPSEGLKHHSKSISQAAENKNVHQPHFDFYTMLPKMQVGNDQEISKTDTGDNVQDNNPLQQHQNQITQNLAKAQENQAGTNTIAIQQQNALQKNTQPINKPNENFNNIDPAKNALDRFETTKEKEQQEKSESPANTTKQTVPDPSSKPSSNNENKSGKTYLVIVKGLETPEQTDQIKAQLLLAGYDVKVEPMNLAGETMNRVLLGPFKSKVEAHQAKKALEGQSVKCEIKELN